MISAPLSSPAIAAFCLQSLAQNGSTGDVHWLALSADPFYPRLSGQAAMLGDNSFNFLQRMEGSKCSPSAHDLCKLPIIFVTPGLQVQPPPGFAHVSNEPINTVPPLGQLGLNLSSAAQQQQPLLDPLARSGPGDSLQGIWGSAQGAGFQRYNLFCCCSLRIITSRGDLVQCTQTLACLITNLFSSWVHPVCAQKAFTLLLYTGPARTLLPASGKGARDMVKRCSSDVKVRSSSLFQARSCFASFFCMQAYWL